MATQEAANSNLQVDIDLGCTYAGMLQKVKDKRAEQHPDIAKAMNTTIYTAFNDTSKWLPHPGKWVIRHPSEPEMQDAENTICSISLN